MTANMVQSSHSISVVIPVYNSDAILPDLIKRIHDTLEKISNCFEVILVNDNSRDNSWNVISKISNENEWVRGINLMRNYGQHNALLCGIRAAKNEIIVTIDDDLQHPPEEIPRLLAKLDEGFDVVYGTPEKEQHGLWRDLASQLTKIAMQNAMGIEIARNVSAFRAFSTHLRDAFVNYQSSFVSIDVLLTWGTTRFAAIPVKHCERFAGSSNYTFQKLITHALNMITGFSALPLKFASVIGFIFAIFGISVLIYIIVNYLTHGGSVPGFSFLASVIAIFSGAQLFALGIIGEYLARMHFRMMERTQYLVRDDTAKINARMNETGLH
jgi:glycosyltransferase involved in cell wall biosynthesis